MSAHSITHLIGYGLVFCSLLALLLVIPEASAAAHKFKPGWRAWVWPLAFLGLLLKNSTETTATLQKMGSSSFLWQMGDLATSFSLTMLVLNSIYRIINDTKAYRYALVVWLIFFLFVFAIFGLGLVAGLFVYETICAAGICTFYGLLYLQQRNRAADAPPVIAGVALLFLSASLYFIPIGIDLALFMVDQVAIAHVVQIVALFFLYQGASNSYTVKYAAQRRLERNSPTLDPKVKV